MLWVNAVHGLLLFYLEKMQDADYRSQNYSYLHALSTRARVQRLEAMKASIRMTAGNLYSSLGTGAEQVLWEVYQDSYQRTAFDTFQSIGIGVDFQQANPRTYKALLEYPWSGNNFSDKIWNKEANFVQALESTLVRGLVQGQSVKEMALALHRAGVGDVDGRGGQYWQAERLIRTEANFILNQATEDAYEAMGVEAHELLLPKE